MEIVRKLGSGSNFAIGVSLATFLATLGATIAFGIQVPKGGRVWGPLWLISLLLSFASAMVLGLNIYERVMLRRTYQRAQEVANSTL